MNSTLNLLSPVKLGRYELPNRVVMAPLTRNRAGAGNVPTELNVTYYAQRASAGLIVTEATQVSPQGVGYPNTPGIHSPEQVEGWKRVTDAVHQQGGRIFCNFGTLGAFLTRRCNRMVNFQSPPVRSPLKITLLLAPWS